MRVMVFVKATAESERLVMPTLDALAEMGRFNDELVKAGVMRTAAGLKPSSQGKRIAFDGLGLALAREALSPSLALARG
jgi:hypothetical protein